MTVTKVALPKHYDLDGVVTVYPYDFKIFAATDLEVKKLSLAGIETTLTLTTDYSVTGAGAENGGNVVLVSAGTAGETLVIRRNIPLTQLTSFRNQRDFFAERHEDAYDRATMQIQQQIEESNRAILLPATFTGETAIVNLIPGYALAINALGTGVECVPNTGADQTALLADQVSASNGSGRVGFTYALAYAEGTVGKAIKDVMDRDTSFTTTGTAPAFTLTPSPALASYVAGQRFRWHFHAAGTTGSNTGNISGLGALSFKQYDSAGTKVSGVIKLGQLADVEYDGTDLVILNPLSGAAGRLIAVTYYLTAGTFTYTKATNNPSFIRVRMVGGGASSGMKASVYTGPGAGGGYSEKTIQASDLNATETIVIGAGGIAATVEGVGNNGGTTSFGAHCSATGGYGGNATYSVPTSGGMGIGGDLNSAGGGEGDSQMPGGSSAFSAGVKNAAGILGSGGASGNGASFAGGPGAMIIEEYA